MPCPARYSNEFLTANCLSLGDVVQEKDLAAVAVVTPAPSHAQSTSAGPLALSGEPNSSKRGRLGAKVETHIEIQRRGYLVCLVDVILMHRFGISTYIQV